MTKKANKKTITESNIRESIRTMIHSVMKEMMNEAVKKVAVDLPPYRMELSSDNQLSFLKNGKLFKSVEVKPSFDKKDLIKLAGVYSKKFNAKITSDLNRI